MSRRCASAGQRKGLYSTAQFGLQLRQLGFLCWRMRELTGQCGTLPSPSLTLFRSGTRRRRGHSATLCAQCCQQSGQKLEVHGLTYATPAPWFQRQVAAACGPWRRKQRRPQPGEEDDFLRQLPTAKRLQFSWLPGSRWLGWR